jgi:hypothetical protein
VQHDDRVMRPRRAADELETGIGATR